MTAPVRYEFLQDNEGPYMGESPFGPWIAFSDYEDLAGRLESAQAAYRDVCADLDRAFAELISLKGGE